jgi:hypothetical protein
VKYIQTVHFYFSCFKRAFFRFNNILGETYNVVRDDGGGVPDDAQLVLDLAVHDPSHDVHALTLVHGFLHRLPKARTKHGDVVPLGLGYVIRARV